MKDKAELPEGWELVELRESPGRRGYGPQGRALSPVERLTFAAMELLYRDDDLIERVERLAGERPDCAVLTAQERPTIREQPSQIIVEHVSVGDHAVGACRDWVAEVVALCHALGCPSLAAMLAQIRYSTKGLRPGRVRATRLRPHTGPGRTFSGSPRRRVGTFNRPARDLLARRAHAVGGLETLKNLIRARRIAKGLEAGSGSTWAAQDPQRGWNSLARELLAEEKGWRDGEVPERRDITYPAWQEWARPPRRRERAPRIRSADDEIGRYLTRQASKIDELLESMLPSLP